MIPILFILENRFIYLNMKKIKIIISTKLFYSSLIFLISFLTLAQRDKLDVNDTKIIKEIFDESLTSRETYKLLDHLCNKIGHRLSGSSSASKAVEWTEMIMSKYNFDKVYKQNLYVPNWKRGEPEVAKIIGQKKSYQFLH